MVNEETHRKVRTYAITGIIILVFVILVAVAYVIFFNKSTAQNVVETPGATYPAGELISNSVCSTDRDCTNKYGANYYCFTGACYYASKSLNTTSRIRSGSGGGSSATGGSGLVGLFANFLTGLATADTGNIIYYDAGYVGIGTKNPNGTLSIKSMNPNSTIQGKQGTVTFFTDVEDIAFDGGNDGIVYLDNLGTQSTAKIAFRNSAYKELLTILNNGKVGIGAPGIASSPDFLDIGGPVRLLPVNSALDGGQIKFEGAGNYPYNYIDNYEGSLRVVVEGGPAPNTAGESEVLRITNDGNVGIGTTSPEQISLVGTKLDVSGSGKAIGMIVGPTDSHHGVFLLRGGTEGSVWEILKGNYGGSDKLAFWSHTGTDYSTGWEERLILLQNGTIILPTLKGTGNRYVCVDSTGTLYASTTACA